MATKVFGCSDDLIEFEGDLIAEVSGSFAADDDENHALVVCSDGTLLDVCYGKQGKGIWAVALLERGSLFERIEICTDDEAEVYSDVAHFKKGLKWAYVAKGNWERAR